MNKKILVSLSVIGAVAAIAIGGTIAYFSDTETSTGNTFTAGSIDLKIDNTSYLNGEPSNSTTWGLTDLTNELFFNFSDLKPGDWGEDTVSLHVYNNDAWGCVTFDNMVDYDNACTEPEEEDGDNTCDNPGPGDGELSGYLYFDFWADVCGPKDGYYTEAYPGDNIFQPECDYDLMDGYASDILPGKTYVLAAPGEYNAFTREMDEPLTGSEDYYIGKVWCFGDLYENFVEHHGSVWTCDGEPVDNIPQSDSLEADIIFYAEQARNNPNFRCVPPETTTVQSAVFNFSSTGWAGWSCPAAYPNIVSADTTNCTQPLAISKAANSSDGQYPVYPHYTYNQAAGETGWVLQNGGTPQSCYIVITCSE